MGHKSKLVSVVAPITKLFVTATNFPVGVNGQTGRDSARGRNRIIKRKRVGL